MTINVFKSKILNNKSNEATDLAYKNESTYTPPKTAKKKNIKKKKIGKSRTIDKSI